MFSVLLHARAEKTFARLDPKRQRQIARAIDKLKLDPSVPSVLLPCGANSLALRVGDFRVVYEINTEAQEVFVLAIGPRGDVYK